jgi:hypothetical protein
VQTEGEFDANDLGLIYNPAGTINGINDSWYFDCWFYVNDTGGLSSVNISLTDTSDTIFTSVDASMVSSGEWYHFEKELDSGFWDDWTTFDSSNGIDSISIFMVNSTPVTSKQLIVDEVHFEIAPIESDVYSESVERVVSYEKRTVLSNFDPETVSYSIGDEYRFSVEIS